MSLAAIQTAVADAIRDKDGVVSTLARDAAIGDAVLRYSTDRPRVVVEDVTAPGGTMVPLPAEWSLSVSALQSVEYPINADPPQYVSPRHVYLYALPSGLQLRFVVPLAASDVIRVTYTALHVLDATTDTIPPAHAHGVACLAASVLCGQLAAHYATEGAPTIAADVTDHRGKTERYRAREKDLRAEYARIVGVPDRVTTPQAASATVELPSRDAFGDRRIFHPPTRRPLA